MIDTLIEWSGSALAAALPGVISFFVTLSVPDTQLRCRCVFEFASRDGLTERGAIDEEGVRNDRSGSLH